MTDAEQHTDNYALLLAEKIGGMAQAINNLAGRIDSLREDHRQGLSDLRSEFRTSQDDTRETVDGLSERVRAIEGQLQSPDPLKHLSADELLTWRNRIRQGHESWQMRVVLAASVAGPIAAFVLAKLFG